MIYFPLLCFLFALAQSQECLVSGCLKCDSNNFKICEQCTPYYQKVNGECLNSVNQTSILNTIKDEDYLEGSPSSSSSTNSQNNNPAGVLNSESTNEQIGKKQINYSISHTLHFSSIGNLVRGAACLYKTSTGICIICNQNYVMRPGNLCVPRPQKCLNFSHSEKGKGAMCTSCAEKYKMIDNNCVDIGCEIDSYYACAKCKPGFYMSIQGQCFDVMCNIIKNGECQRCFKGYLLNSQGRCIRDLNAVASLMMNDELIDQQKNLDESTATITNNSTTTTTTTQVQKNQGNNFSHTSNSTFSQSVNNISPVNNTSNIYYPPTNNTLTTNQNSLPSNQISGSNQDLPVTNNVSTPATTVLNHNQSITTPSSSTSPNSGINTVPNTNPNMNSNSNDNSNSNYGNIYNTTSISTNIIKKDGQEGISSDTGNNVNLNTNSLNTSNYTIFTNNTGSNTEATTYINSNVTATNFQVNRNDNSQNTIWNTSITTSNQSTSNPQNITTTVIFNPSINNQTNTIFNTATYQQTTNSAINNSSSSQKNMSSSSQNNVLLPVQNNSIASSNTSIPSNLPIIGNNTNISYNSSSYDKNTVQNLNTTNIVSQNITNVGVSNITNTNNQANMNTVTPLPIVSIQMPPNCITLSKEAPIRCIRCEQNYYLTNAKNVSDSSNYCRKISRFCSSYDSLGNCKTCDNSTMLKSGTCVDPNCEKYTDQQNTDDRYCHTCKTGYYLNGEIGGVCSIIFKDDNCINIHINICLQCRIGYYINPEDSHCLPLPDNCYDKDCIYCQEGYVSIQNSCKKITNCSRISGNTCEICQPNFAITKFGTCLSKISFCIEYSYDGCSKCSINSLLTKNKTCSINPNYVDPYCRIKSRNQCSICSNGYYINEQTTLCEPVSPLCATFNAANGHCTSCYSGYFLNSFSGECLEKKPILNCAEQDNNRCLRCSNRYYLSSATQCREVDKLCNDYDENFGFCKTCYSGYVIYNGLCLLQGDYDKLGQNGVQKEVQIVTRIVQPVREEDIVYVEKIQSIYCKKIDPNDSTACLQCYNAFYLDSSSKKCLRVNPVCRTYNNMTGQCKSCYNGYELIFSNNFTTCLPLDLQRYSSPTQVPSLKVIENSVCLKRDETLQKCLECPSRYYNSNGICIEAIPECKEFDKQTGQCFQCYTSYKPSQSLPQSCEFSMNEVLVPYCQDYTNPELGQPICLKCLSGYYLKDSECTAIPIVCKQFDVVANECSECINGYVLVKQKESEISQCVQPAIDDENCAVYGVNGFCQICKNGQQVINGKCAQ